MLPSAIDPALAPQGAATAAINLHPVGLFALDDDAQRKAVEAAAAATLERLIPGVAVKIAAIDFEPPVPASAPIAIAAERALAYARAGRIAR
jgi:phytoene dehydrogenase-like protein